MRRHNGDPNSASSFPAPNVPPPPPVPLVLQNTQDLTRLIQQQGHQQQQQQQEFQQQEFQQQELQQREPQQQQLRQQRPQQHLLQPNPLLTPTMPAGVSAPGVYAPGGLPYQQATKDHDAVANAMALVVEAARSGRGGSGTTPVGIPHTVPAPPPVAKRRRAAGGGSSSNQSFPQSSLVYSNTAPPLPPSVNPSVLHAPTSLPMSAPAPAAVPIPAQVDANVAGGGTSDILSELNNAMKATGQKQQRQGVIPGAGFSAGLHTANVGRGFAQGGLGMRSNLILEDTSLLDARTVQNTERGKPSVSSNSNVGGGVATRAQNTHRQGIRDRAPLGTPVSNHVLTSGGVPSQDTNIAIYQRQVQHAATVAAAAAAKRYGAGHTNISDGGANRASAPQVGSDNAGGLRRYATGVPMQGNKQMSPEALRKYMERKKEEHRAQLLAERKRLRLDRMPTNDQFRVLNPDYRTPFQSKVDAWQRLIPYHVLLTDGKDGIEKSEHKEYVEKAAKAYAKWIGRVQNQAKDKLKKFDDAEALIAHREGDIDALPREQQGANEDGAIETSLTPAETMLVSKLELEDEIELRRERLREEAAERARQEARARAEAQARLEQARLEQVRLEQMRMEQEMKIERQARLQEHAGLEQQQHAYLMQAVTSGLGRGPKMGDVQALGFGRHERVGAGLPASVPGTPLGTQPNLYAANTAGLRPGNGITQQLALAAKYDAQGAMNAQLLARGGEASRLGTSQGGYMNTCNNMAGSASASGITSVVQASVRGEADAGGAVGNSRLGENSSQSPEIPGPSYGLTPQTDYQGMW